MTTAAPDPVNDSAMDLPAGPGDDHRGGMRMDAVERIVVGGLYALLYFTIIAPILITVGLVLAVVDVLWQLVLGSEGIAPMNLFTSAWNAQFNNLTWALTGSGSFDLTIFG